MSELIVKPEPPDPLQYLDSTQEHLSTLRVLFCDGL